jgi:hypothetical protein
MLAVDFPRTATNDAAHHAHPTQVSNLRLDLVKFLDSLDF